METWMWIVIVLAVALVIGLIVYAAVTRRRSAELRERFGPEYDVAMTESDSRREAEAELAARRERRERYTIRPLSAEARERYSSRWQEVQARFVDSPQTALEEADLLVLELMRERGYPSADFEQRAADISVDHPEVVRHYRAAHAVSVEASQRAADTERMREGLIHFRALFDELLRDAGDVEEEPVVERRVG